MDKEAIVEKKETADASPVVVAVVRQRLKERYPEENPETDDAWEQVYGRYMDESEGELSRYREAECRLNELCRAYPEFGEVVHEMVANRLPFRAAVARVLSADDLIPQEGDEDYDACRTAWEERLERVEKRERQTREIAGNEARSLEAIDRFCEEKGLSEEEKDGLVELINDHFADLLYKRISPSMLEGFFKQMSFDLAVEEAAKAGELRGRNQQIEARRAQERAGRAGDGLPGAGGGGAIRPVDTPRERHFFDLPERRRI